MKSKKRIVKKDMKDINYYSRGLTLIMTKFLIAQRQLFLF